MIKISDGTQTKRIAGKTGDRTPQAGLKRDRTVYVASGGETSIDLSLLSPQINYMPGSNQISVKRSSLGSLISGFSFFERDVSTIGFSSALVAGERVEIIKEIEIVGIQAATPRPDIYTAILGGGTPYVTADFSWPYNLNPTKAAGGCEVYLNGKLMSRGQDYNEVNLGLANTNKIQFTFTASGNLVIKPTYQVIDQSSASSTFFGQQLAGIQGSISAGTQGFVDVKNSNSLFTSSITNKEKINLDRNLKVSFGIERIMTQGVFEIQNEFGPNGQPVFGAINDDQQLARFVGAGWQTAVGTSGPAVSTKNRDDYIEIAFFGTGLNLLIANSSMELRVSLNGGPENQISTQSSSLLLNNNYSPNIICPILNDINLQINVAKIRLNQEGSSDINTLRVQGFEILNNSYSSPFLKINPGVSYLNGQKYTLERLSNIPYYLNSSGTKGGRSVVYLSSDGSIKNSFRAVDNTIKHLSLANHEIEEIAKTYFVREFGSSASVSLSSSFTSGSIKYTLDDNLTTLNILNGQFVSGLEKEAVACRLNDGKISFTFIGTGLDIELLTDSLNRTFSNITIDNVVVPSSSVTKSGRSEIKKIVSGLPYGSHTVVFNSSVMNSPAISRFIVYQPLKPSAPSDSIELADYNLMAQYSLATSSQNFSIGVIGKSPLREMACEGAPYILSSSTTDLINGSMVLNGSLDSVEHAFFGSGVDLYLNSTNAGSAKIYIDGFLYQQETSIVGTNCFWTDSTGTVSWSSASSNIVSILDLPIRNHTVKIVRNSGTIELRGMGIVSPVHSHGTNPYSNFQNTFHVGNNSLTDLRKTSMIKNTQFLSRSWAQSNQITSLVTNTSTFFVPCQNLSCSIRTSGKPIQISYSLSTLVEDQIIYATVYLNGISTTYEKSVFHSTECKSVISDIVILQVPAGFHKIDVYWKVSNGTGSADNRNLTVVEL